jgi:hypothetical protein
MPGRLRRRTSYSSSNDGTSYYVAEKLALFGAMHIASCKCSPLNRVLTNVQTTLLRPEGGASIACFNLAIPRSSGLRCPASHSNMRKRATSCETCPNDSSRPPFRRSRRKRLLSGGLGVVADAPAGRARTRCFCRPTAAWHVGRCGVGVRRLCRRQCGRPAALAIVRTHHWCGQGTISIRRQRAGLDIAGIEIGVVRHVEVRRDTLHDRRLTASANMVLGRSHQPR